MMNLTVINFPFNEEYTNNEFSVDKFTLNPEFSYSLDSNFLCSLNLSYVGQLFSNVYSFPRLICTLK